MRQGKLIYFGKYLKPNNSVGYIYYELSKNNELEEKWKFSKPLFRKGTIGSIYDCEFENTTVLFNKNTIPTSFISEESGRLVDSFLKFPKLYKAEEQTRQIDIQLKNAKKPETLLDIEVKRLKETYKSLNPQARSSFIGNVVFKITN